MFYALLLMCDRVCTCLRSLFDAVTAAVVASVTAVCPATLVTDSL
jgi:hypothetical protein